MLGDTKKAKSDWPTDRVSYGVTYTQLKWEQNEQSSDNEAFLLVLLNVIDYYTFAYNFVLLLLY